MPDLNKLLDPDLVVFLRANTREEALSELIGQLVKNGCLDDPKPFFNAVLAREKIVSTGIGMGVAIPHAKLPHTDHFFLAIGIHRQGIPWEALDEAPARLIFLIGGPDDKRTEYLQILSKLTSAIKDGEHRKKVMQADNADDLIYLLKHPPEVDPSL